MTKPLNELFSQLENFLNPYNLILKKNKGASEAELVNAQKTSGIAFDDFLCQLYRYCNGIDEPLKFYCKDAPENDAYSFLIKIGDELFPCDFLSLESALCYWKWATETAKDDYSRIDTPRDPRIQPARLYHSLWFPIAQWNGDSVTVYFDADPSPEGKYGQIIAFLHDPDDVHFIADSMEDFFTQSNQRYFNQIEEIYDLR